MADFHRATKFVPNPHDFGLRVCVGFSKTPVVFGIKVSSMDLNNLRNRLNELDRQLIELIAERQSVVEKVGEQKRSAGQATRDYAREKQVLDGVRSDAEELGIAPDIAEQVMRLLIQTSLTRQERARVCAEGQGEGKKALAAWDSWCSG